MIKKVLLVLTICVLIAAGVLAVFIWSPVMTSRRIQRLLAAIELGKTTLSDFQRQISQKNLTRVTLVHCSGDECVAAFATGNQLMSKWHLAPATAVRSEVKFKAGFAEGLFLWMYTTDKTVIASSRIDETLHAQEFCAHRICYAQKNQTNGRPMVRAIMVTPEASQQDRAAVFRLNFNCLARIGGCSTAEQMIPFPDGIVFTDWRLRE